MEAGSRLKDEEDTPTSVEGSKLMDEEDAPSLTILELSKDSNVGVKSASLR